jgi:hypothetical protein
MNFNKPGEDLAAHRQIRRCLLMALYAMFREYPYAAIELSYLQEECRVSTKDLNWNIVYLEKKKLIELDKSGDCPPYIACSVTISAAGIDLVEDKEKFNQVLPQGE